MKTGYSVEKAVQIVIALLKKSNIHRVIVSPGSANDTFVFSVQSDPFFKLYSCVDERSAAYMACGMAEETNEPIVISCTGATASRNYIPALTEAYYRKLPILAITATRPIMYVGHNRDQLIDRSVIAKDAIKFSVDLPVVKDEEDFWDCEIKVNKAISELSKDGGGPVHINLPTVYNRDYSAVKLPDVRKIDRFDSDDDLPDINHGQVAIYIASHKTMSKESIEQIDLFCEKYNAVVFCEHTSGYNGKYKVPFFIANAQAASSESFYPALEIELGEIAGIFRMPAKSIWRVSDDGEIRDVQKKLKAVFYMKESHFFAAYNARRSEVAEMTYYQACMNRLDELYRNIPGNLPFSNMYAASKLAPEIPRDSVLHFGILNSLRCWNYFKLDDSIRCYANVGGYGIDGCVSSLIGASFIHPEKLYFGVFGDLAFFYDLNSLGNRDIKSNVRILIINNGLGGEFKNYFSPANDFGAESNLYVCAEGHYGHKSRDLIKHYCQDLGFEYLSASTKAEFEMAYKTFVDPAVKEKPLLFEVFTDSLEDSRAIYLMNNLDKSAGSEVKRTIKNIIGRRNVDKIKRVLKK